MENIKFSDFPKICRTCLIQKEAMEPLHKCQVPEMLSSFTTIKVEIDDDLPVLICSECIAQIVNCYNFKQQCENSDQILQQIRIQKTATSDQDEYTSGTEQKLKEPIKNEKTKGTSEKDNTDNDDDFQNDSQKTTASDNESCKNDSTEDYDLLTKSDNCACKICGKVLVTIHTLARHMQIHNKNRKFTHRCSVCQKGFYEKGHLNKHMRRHEGATRYSCEICSKEFYELSAQAVHMAKHNVKPMSCTICDKRFLVKLQLEIHMKGHTKQPSNICSYCGKRYITPSKLERHKLSHESTRAYACKFCDSKFKHSFTLNQHVRQIHQGIKRKKDVCTICGKSVAHLKHHIYAKHSNQRPYNCEECGAGFVSNSLLNTHVRSKHKGESLLNALCNVCGKRCQTRAVLEIHMRSHTKERPFKCETCGKAFMAAGALKTHTRSHTGERPYGCTTCGKAFSTSTLLKIHNRIHTGERPYACNVCDRTFRQKCTLATHLKKLH